MGTYGQGWNLNDADDNGFYAVANQPIDAAPYTGQAGVWGYNEVHLKILICNNLAKL